MARGREVTIRLAHVTLAGLVVWFAWRALAPRWSEVRAAQGDLVVHVGWIAASAALVLLSYAVLIETWRRTVMRWGHRLPIATAVRIWCISNLGKYLPGKIWQITAMGAMAREAGVPATAAIGSSLLIAVVNVLAGGLVVLIAADDAALIPRAATVVGTLTIAALILLPHALPRLTARLARWRGRDLQWPTLTIGDLLRIFLGCAMAWCLYGIAFRWLAWGTLAGTSGAVRYYIATFTLSYLAGFLALIAPGGVGVREVGFVALAPRFGLMSFGAATLFALISRLWLTILELLPGLLLLLSRSATRTTPADE